MTREETILSLESQVLAIASQIYRKLPRSIALSDLIAEGWIGAIAAVDRFDPGRNLKLKTFAETKIRGRVLDYLRRSDFVGKRERARIRAGKKPAPTMTSLSSIFHLPDGRAMPVFSAVEARHDVPGIIRRANLTPRERSILHSKFWNDQRNRQIANDIGVHESRVWHILERQILPALQRCC